jgi:co-chaperonin GroES (HSP10)
MLLIIALANMIYNRITMKFFLILIFIGSCFCVYSQDDEITILFDKGQSELIFTEKSKIENFLSSHTQCKFEIIGYADNKGTLEKNVQLSLLRAEQVMKYLIYKGIKSENIEAIGGGQINDTELNKDERSRSQNRKVVISTLCDVKIPAVGDIDKNLQSSNDTIIIGELGTIVKMDKRNFAGMDMKQVEIRLTEMYSYCDSIPDDLMTATSNGVCLRSGGMAQIEVFYKKRSKKIMGRPIEVMIPVKDNDTTFQFYVAVRKGGNLLFEEAKGKIVSENGKKYYVFKQSRLVTINCDKPIPGCNIFEKGYKLKVWPSYGTVRVFLKDGFSFVRATNYIRRRKVFSIPKLSTPNNIIVEMGGWKNQLKGTTLSQYPYRTDKVYILAELRTKSKNERYRLKKQNFIEGNIKQGQKQIGVCN